MAMTGIIGDFIAYIFIRANGWFEEGDFIIHNGATVHVVDIEWRFTKAYSFANKCFMYIPNGILGNKELTNQSQDNARWDVQTIPLDPNLPGSVLETIVKDVWALLRAQDGTFTALSGKSFPNQLEITQSGCRISDFKETESAKGGQITLNVKLVAKYFYSKCPEQDKSVSGKSSNHDHYSDEVGDDWRDHQFDWVGGWNAQKEIILIGIQKILEKNGAFKGK